MSKYTELYRYLNNILIKNIQTKFDRRYNFFHLAYNNWRTNDTCNFYRNKVPIGDLMSAVIISRLNVFAGLRLSEEIQAMYSN